MVSITDWITIPFNRYLYTLFYFYRFLVELYGLVHIVSNWKTLKVQKGTLLVKKKQGYKKPRIQKKSLIILMQLHQYTKYSQFAKSPEHLNQ
jgi:hypothetical protein